MNRNTADPVAASVDTGQREQSVAAIDVSHLQKRYGSVVAVEDVSFTVAKGEIFGLLGRNGAGKTTTVESVVGLRRPDGGTIRVLGFDPVADHAALTERVGTQLQESAFPPKLRVGEALSLYASFYHDPETPESLLEILDLSAKQRAYFRDLSGGQKQRLSIAVALVGRPSIAVLDELTTGLDPQARRDTWGLVEAVRDRGVTIVLVTHNMDEAQHLCDRVALIDAGHVVAIDTPAQLAERAAGGQRVRFRPSAPFDPALLTSRPEVRSLTNDGDWMVATGQGDLVNAVILTLAEVGVSAHEVTAESGSLEDAFLALTGRGALTDDLGVTAPNGTSQPHREYGASGAWRTVWRRGRGGPAPPRAAFGRLVASEWRLALRVPVGLVWGLGFPLIGLVIFGILPATNTPDSAYGGLTFFEVYLPVMIAFSLATMSLIALPIPLASYRELGVLRRMATTPVPPSWVLGAQVVINLALVAVAVLVIIVGGTVAFGAHLRLQPLGFVVSLALSAAAMFAIGLWVAAIARTQRTAGPIGACLLFPSLFFAGVWLPQEAMPPTLRTISALSPLGAAVHAMDTSMLTGHFPPAEPLFAMAAWAVLFAWLAVRMFRWE